MRATLQVIKWEIRPSEIYSNSTRHNINARLYDIKNLLSDQEGYHKNKQTAHCIGENRWQLLFRWGLLSRMHKLLQKLNSKPHKTADQHISQ